MGFAGLVRSFPQPDVTSDLDPKIQRADHRQGGGGAGRNRERGFNSFVLKILTSKPLGLKILQSIFANPAPVAAFRGVGEGGTPETCYFPEMDSPKKRSSVPLSEIFFRRFRYN